LLTFFVPGPCLLSTKVFDTTLNMSKFFLSLFSYWSPTMKLLMCIYFRFRKTQWIVEIAAKDAVHGNCNPYTVNLLLSRLYTCIDEKKSVFK
jgi:hypothetical protein